MDQEVVIAEQEFESLKNPQSVTDIENLTKITAKTFEVEIQNRSTINLNQIESHIVKAKHFATYDEEDDFV